MKTTSGHNRVPFLRVKERLSLEISVSSDFYLKGARFCGLRGLLEELLRNDRLKLSWIKIQTGESVSCPTLRQSICVAPTYELSTIKLTLPSECDCSLRNCAVRVNK